MPYDNPYNRQIAEELDQANRNYALIYHWSPVNGINSGGSHVNIGNASKRDGEDGIYNNNLSLGESYYYGDGMSGGNILHDAGDWFNDAGSTIKGWFGGNGFAEGTFRDTGFNHVEGVGGVAHYRKPRREEKEEDLQEYHKKELGEHIDRMTKLHGAGFWDDFKRGFNMVFEPASKYLLKPLATVTGNPLAAAGLTALGYGKSGGAYYDDVASPELTHQLDGQLDNSPEPRQVGGEKKRGRKAKMEGGFKVGDLFTKDFWNNIKVEGGKKLTKKHKQFMIGGFKLGDLGNMDFWNSISIGGKAPTQAQKKALIGGFKLGDLGNLDFWKNITISGGSRLGPPPASLKNVRGGTKLGLPDGAVVGKTETGGKRGRPRKIGGAILGTDGKLLAMDKVVLPNGVPPRAQLGSNIGGAKPKGKGMSGGDGRKKRAEIVKKIMKEKGMKMIEASKYVKEHNLY
jgi:hypothetical protein